MVNKKIWCVKKTKSDFFEKFNKEPFWFSGIPLKTLCAAWLVNVHAPFFFTKILFNNKIINAHKIFHN